MIHRRVSHESVPQFKASDRAAPQSLEIRVFCTGLSLEMKHLRPLLAPLQAPPPFFSCRTLCEQPLALLTGSETGPHQAVLFNTLHREDFKVQLRGGTSAAGRFVLFQETKPSGQQRTMEEERCK